MQPMPLEHVRQCTFGKFPVHNACFDFHCDVEPPVDRMEMRWTML